MSLDSPVVDEPIPTLVDWLELRLIVSGENEVRFGQLANALEIGRDTDGVDIDEDDSQMENIAAGVASEIEVRLKALGNNAYPFRLSDNGQRLNLLDINTYGQYAYLISLVLQHSWASGKLLQPCKLTAAELHTGRQIFEVLATIAAIGLVSGRGPAFLMGNNRGGAEGLKERLRTICRIAGEGRVRTIPHEAEPANAIDDKVDVIALDLERDGPPAKEFILGQASAGENFTDKSISNEIRRYLQIWFEQEPQWPKGYMFIPKLLEQHEVSYETPRLGHLVHRLRLPRYAEEGAILVESDSNLLHFVEDTETPKVWLNSYLERVLGELAE